MAGDRGHTIATVGRAVSGQLYANTDHDPRNTVLIAGSGRSGTTWLAEIVNHRNDYRYIFEPFHPQKVALSRGFRSRQYLRPGDGDPRLVDPAARVLSGRVRSVWTDKFNRKRLAKRRLIKEIRGNLLLGWIHHTFTEIPIVLMLRHPCAVVHSQLAREWNWRVDLADLSSQDALMEDHLEQFHDIVENARTRFERQVLLWCIENYVPMRQFGRDQVHVVFYEHLCLNPAAELKRLFSFLGSELDGSLLQEVATPSALSRGERAITSRVIDRWKDGLTDDETKRAIELLEIFGLSRLYGEDPLPLVPRGADALAPGRGRGL
jgi:hypothetical protein